MSGYLNALQSAWEPLSCDGNHLGPFPQLSTWVLLSDWLTGLANRIINSEDTILRMYGQIHTQAFDERTEGL